MVKIKPKYDIYLDEESHIYYVDGKEVPSVTTVLSPLSNVEYDKVNPSVLEQAAKRGTLVHSYTEMMDYDCDPDEVEYEVVGYLKAYKDFLRDYKPEWTRIECPVAKMDTDRAYAGTIDRVGRINGKLVIVDLKTLASPTKLNKFSVCVQTWAYDDALYDTYGEDAEGRYALYLKADGTYNFMDCEEYEEKYDIDPYSIFNKCYEVLQLTTELKQIKPVKKGDK